MKKKGVLLIIFLIILIISFFSIEKGMEEVTTKGILDTMATVTVSILVDADAPRVIIDSPENRSYFSGDNIALNYIVTDTTTVSSIKYNLDNGANTTLTGNTSFDASAGSHTLYMFADDIHGFLNNSEFVSFFVGNPSEEKIVDANGNITFDDKTIDEVIDKISNLPVGASVNATLYNNTRPSDWEEPSSTLVETTFQYFEISVNESTTGGSYTIYFNLTSAEIGSTDADDIRLFIYENTSWEELTTTVIDSSSDPLSFSAVTTHFSEFLVGEKAAAEEAPPTGEVVGGSAAAKGGIKEVTPEIIKEPEEPPKPIHIPGEFFDVSNEIPEKYRILLAGEELIGMVNIISIRKIGMVSLNVEYYIEDMDENIIFKGFETKVIENEITYDKKIKLPLDLEEGYYMFIVKVKYKDDIAIAGYPFKIVKKTVTKILDYTPILIGIIIILILIKFRRDKIKLEKSVKSLKNKKIGKKIIIKKGKTKKDSYIKTKRKIKNILKRSK